LGDVPEVRRLFSWARIEEVTTTYTIGNHAERGARRSELLISGSAS
jgi:DNA adenine methylase